MKYEKMRKKQILAAETFRYSYANYANHCGIGNARFDHYMPKDVEILEKADKEGWDIAQLAEKLEREVKYAERLLKQYRRAKEVIFAPNAGTSFEIAVRQCIENALEDGLSTSKDIDVLVEQICYRAADLAYLLDMEGRELSDYSEQLRRHKNMSSGS